MRHGLKYNNNNNIHNSTVSVYIKQVTKVVNITKTKLDIYNKSILPCVNKHVGILVKTKDRNYIKLISLLRPPRFIIIETCRRESVKITLNIVRKQNTSTHRSSYHHHITPLGKQALQQLPPRQVQVPLPGFGWSNNYLNLT